jgi:very-short-patch-repair endonuclease
MCGYVGQVRAANVRPGHHDARVASTTRLDRAALTAILGRQIDVITRAQAQAVGVTESALRHRLRPDGPWRVLLPTVYIAATGVPSLAQQQLAAQLYGGRGSVITGSAAALSHRIRAPQSEFVDVLVPLTRQRQNASFARLHRTSRMPERVHAFGPIRYAPAPRAVGDTVRGLASLRDVRAVVADAVQRRLCEVQELSAELNAGPNQGSALFREALTDVADGIRSAAEGDLKDLLRRSGLPMPLFNATVFAGDTFVAIPDAWWPEFGVAIEIDSHEWHMSPQDHARTLDRQRRMGKHGIVVLPFTPKQIRKQPAAVIAEIRDALDSARGRPPQGNLRTVPAGQTAA